MDFKARFQGKTSKINKEGQIDGNTAGFDEPATPHRNSSVSKKDKITAHKYDNSTNNISQGGGDPSKQMGITRNSKFSYKSTD